MVVVEVVVDEVVVVLAFVVVVDVVLVVLALVLVADVTGMVVDVDPSQVKGRGPGMV